MKTIIHNSRTWVNKTFKDIDALQRYDLTHCKFTSCRFEGISTEVLKLENCVFIDCFFNNVYAYNVIIKDCSFRACTFNKSLATGYSFSTTYANSNLEGVAFYSFVFYYGRFKECMLPTGKPSRTKFIDMSFQDTVVPEWLAADLTIVPSEGEFIAWKVLRDGLIAKVLIPTHAKRSNAEGRKCRASEAKVLAIYKAGTEVEVSTGTSIGYSGFAYTTGETVTPSCWCANRWEECAPGIHFFMTRYEAEHYM